MGEINDFFKWTIEEGRVGGYNVDFLQLCRVTKYVEKRPYGKSWSTVPKIENPEVGQVPRLPVSEC